MDAGGEIRPGQRVEPEDELAERSRDAARHETRGVEEAGEDRDGEPDLHRPNAVRLDIRIGRRRGRVGLHHVRDIGEHPLQVLSRLLEGRLLRERRGPIGGRERRERLRAFEEALRLRLDDVQARDQTGIVGELAPGVGEAGEHPLAVALQRDHGRLRIAGVSRDHREEHIAAQGVQLGARLRPVADRRGARRRPGARIGERADRGPLDQHRRDRDAQAAQAERDDLPADRPAEPWPRRLGAVVVVPIRLPAQPHRSSTSRSVPEGVVSSIARATSSSIRSRSSIV